MFRCRWSQNRTWVESKQQQQNTTLKDKHGGEQALSIFIAEKDGKSERYAMFFIADLSLPVLNNIEKNIEKKKYSVSKSKNLIIKRITNTDTESTELCSSTRVKAK